MNWQEYKERVKYYAKEDYNGYKKFFSKILYFFFTFPTKVNDWKTKLDKEKDTARNRLKSRFNKKV